MSPDQHRLVGTMMKEMQAELVFLATHVTNSYPRARRFRERLLAMERKLLDTRSELEKAMWSEHPGAIRCGNPDALGSHVYFGHREGPPGWPDPNYQMPRWLMSTLGVQSRLGPAP